MINLKINNSKNLNDTLSHLLKKIIILIKLHIKINLFLVTILQQKKLIYIQVKNHINQAQIILKIFIIKKNLL